MMFPASSWSVGVVDEDACCLCIFLAWLFLWCLRIESEAITLCCDLGIFYVKDGVDVEFAMIDSSVVIVLNKQFSSSTFWIPPPAAAKQEQEMSSSQICWPLAVLALFLLSSAFADEVVVLTEDNFEKEVAQDRAALVEFYAPWYYAKRITNL
ncbi:hypothetical protein RHMOL_Rhmol07G0097900 [Rhododendron molle]|uniref:Uncharacterized protein n=1 Tax=Rhododendron molle TaxID=49168 RepID=A0ACC0MYQ9_RHOML|nr:hypothetical protein RHMOL_Rhmol07G0097900 [Rhododendron molle]